MWHTYAPDGRSLIIRKSGTSWIASCGPVRVEAETAAEAIRGALVDSNAQLSEPDEKLEAWITEHAAELEAISP